MDTPEVIGNCWRRIRHAADGLIRQVPVQHIFQIFPCRRHTQNGSFPFVSNCGSPLVGGRGKQMEQCIERQLWEPRWEVASIKQSVESRENLEQPAMTTSQSYMFFLISSSEYHSDIFD